MPKLIIKQQLPAPSSQEKLVGALQTVIPVLLIIIVLVAVASLYLSSSGGGESSAIEASLNMKLPAVYTRQEEHLKELSSGFDELAQSPESYDKHQQLVTRSEAILQQLAEMDRIVNDLSLSNEDKQALLSRHQYQKDYWESKLVFHRLRLARFKVNNPAVTQDALREAVGEALDARQAETAPADKAPKPESIDATKVVVPAKPMAESPGETAPMADTMSANKEQTVQQDQAGAEAHPAPAEAGLPPGVELPPGMCPLFGPGAAACKPGAEDKQ